jgi:hypothetical protein
MVFLLDSISPIFDKRRMPHTETSAQRSLRLLDWLSAEFPSLGAPWEMCHRDDEEAVARIRNTRQGIIPREERSEESEVAASLDAASIGAFGIVMQVADTQQEEGHVQGEKEEEEGDGRFERAEKEDRCEDEPSLDLLLVWVPPRRTGSRSPSRRDRTS